MKADKIYYVYMLASKKNGVLYIGMTNDLERRIHEHRMESVRYPLPVFTGTSRTGMTIILYHSRLPSAVSQNYCY